MILTKRYILTIEEILSYDQKIVMEQAKFTYWPLRKALEKKPKQMKIKEKNERNLRQLVESNALVKKMFMIVKIITNYI